MARRKKGELPPIHRTDLLPHGMNAGKERAVLDLLRHWQRGAVELSKEQWRLFFEAGAFDKNHLGKDLTPVVGAANRLQMCRWHVVGQLKSWVGNRANDFAELVQKSDLPGPTKRLLHGINRREAWFRRDALAIDGAEVPDDVRRLARCLMRRVMARHRRPDLSRTNMVLDQRAVTLASAAKASAFPLWLRLSTMEPGRRIEVPLRSCEFFEERRGQRALSVQVNRDRESGAIRFGVVTDVARPFAESRAEYVPLREQLAFDFCLATMLATNEGDLLGRGWMRRLASYDRKITGIARHVQRTGGKPNRSANYRAAVASLRGFIESEVGRVLNRLVALKKPARLVVERLDFQVPGLSRRMNRLLQNCGRAAIRAKLKDLEQKFGITSEEVNPAYTSQECACCGYVDARNRRDQSSFRCLWCGTEKHADANAGQNIGQRRSLAIGSVWVKKAAVLSDLVTRFAARWPSLRGATGSRGAPTDPRLTNPYFAQWAAGIKAAAARSADRRETAMKSSNVAQALVAA